jgi:DNA-binding IscR family transcriptional regulator
MGTGGGALLARPAASITLLDVYRAVDEEREIIPLHPSPNPRCPVGRNIHGLLTGRITAAESALAAELAATTVADLAGDLAKRLGRERAG